MKIGILTFHRAHNYGAVLQCYALQETLKKMGHTVEVIDYYPEYLLTPYRIFSISRLSNYNPLKIMKAFAIELLLMSKRVKRYHAFKTFINKNLNLSPTVNGKNIPSTYDTYIIGSDQIWNPAITKGFDPVYFGFFNFDKAGKKIIAYAASMESKMLDEKSKEFYINALNNFDAVSVRESKLAELLQPLHSKKIETVIDPTLLADRCIWNRIIARPKIKEKYVLVYQVRRNKNTIRIAKNIAKQINAIVIEVTAWHTTHFNKYRFQCSSPEEFLGFIKNAACVVTTSFHGTAFSVIFNRPFYCIELGDNGNTRSQSFLNSIGLCDRMLKKDETPKYTEIDYDNKINNIIVKIREASLRYLRENIKEL